MECVNLDITTNLCCFESLTKVVLKMTCSAGPSSVASEATSNRSFEVPYLVNDLLLDGFKEIRVE